MEIKDIIKERLNKQNLQDMKAILQTPEGRRFFSWLLENCGLSQQLFYGNSRDIYFSGIRSVALMLIACCNELGTEGVKLKQQAEMDYLKLQMSIRDDIQRKMKENQQY